MFAARTLVKRTMATATVAAKQPTANASRLVASLVGAVVLVPVIALAPANSFDDLDCQSHCQRKLMEGLSK